VKGPEIRTGDIPEPIDLEEGQLIDFLTEPGLPFGKIPAVTVNYHGLGRDVLEGSTILVDSGIIRLVVEEATPARVRCRVVVPARLTSRRHVNLPGVKVRLPALTAKDRADIAVGIAEQVDFFALSFVRE